MSTTRCPICAEVLGQITHVISGVPVLFWLCPDPLCGYEAEVKESAAEPAPADEVGDPDSNTSTDRPESGDT